MAKAKKKADPFNFDDYRQQVPAFYYKRLIIDNNFDPTNSTLDINWTFPLDFGYGFLLRRISAKWPDNSDTNWVPVLNVRLFNVVRGATYQNERYPLRQVATPGSNNVRVVVAPAPHDMDAFGVSMTALSLKNRLVYNLYYKYRDTVYVKLNFEQTGAEFGIFKVDIMLDGYLIPEKDLAMWE